MRIAFVLLLLLVGKGISAQTSSEIATPEQAREYASEHMWASVEVLPAEDCKWIVRTEGNKEAEPRVGDIAKVRNTNYQLLADTIVTRIQCSVIDFSLEEMSSESADSTIAVMLNAYRRMGSFERMVDEYLQEDEKYRYVLFNEDSGEMFEILGVDLSSHSKGDVFVVQDREGQPFKFIVYIREDPKQVEGFIVLKTRAE